MQGIIPTGLWEIMPESIQKEFIKARRRCIRYELRRKYADADGELAESRDEILKALGDE